MFIINKNIVQLLTKWLGETKNIEKKIFFKSFKTQYNNKINYFKFYISNFINLKITSTWINFFHKYL